MFYYCLLEGVGDLVAQSKVVSQARLSESCVTDLMMIVKVYCTLKRKSFIIRARHRQDIWATSLVIANSGKQVLQCTRHLVADTEARLFTDSA